MLIGGAIVGAFVFVCALFRVGRLSDDQQYDEMEREHYLRHLEKRNPK